MNQIGAVSDVRPAGLSESIGFPHQAKNFIDSQIQSPTLSGNTASVLRDVISGGLDLDGDDAARGSLLRDINAMPASAEGIAQRIVALAASAWGMLDDVEGETGGFGQIRSQLNNLHDFDGASLLQALEDALPDPKLRNDVLETFSTLRGERSELLEAFAKQALSNPDSFKQVANESQPQPQESVSQKDTSVVESGKNDNLVVKMGVKANFLMSFFDLEPAKDREPAKKKPQNTYEAMSPDSMSSQKMLKTSQPAAAVNPFEQAPKESKNN